MFETRKERERLVDLILAFFIGLTLYEMVAQYYTKIDLVQQGFILGMLLMVMFLRMRRRKK